MLNLHQKKKWYLDEVSLFIGRFNVASVPKMGNKIALAVFLYTPAEWTEKIFILNIFDIYSSMYIKERGR